MIPDDRLLSVTGDPCPICGAYEGEAHSTRCDLWHHEYATCSPRADIVLATCGPVCVDGDGREVEP